MHIFFVERKMPLGRYKRRWDEYIHWILKIVWWTHLTQDRDQWQGAVNPAMNLQVAEHTGNVAEQDVLSCMQSVRSQHTSGNAQAIQLRSQIRDSYWCEYKD